jgi:hypothetical protein
MILAVVAVFFSLSTLSFSQVWYQANQRTLTWDPVTQTDTGTPFPAGDVIKYKVFYKVGYTITEVGETAQPSWTFTFPTEADYFLGAQTVRIPAGLTEAEAIKSEVAWSDNPANCKDNVSFGIRFYSPPKPPAGLRAQ